MTAARTPSSTPKLWAWQARLLRLGASLLLLGVLALVLAGIVVASGVRDAGTPSADGSTYPQVVGPMEITLESPGLIGVFYPAGGPFPDGTCTLTDPQGADVPMRTGTDPLETMRIDGVDHYGVESFEAPAGTSTITCENEGWRAGPAFSIDHPDPGAAFRSELTAYASLSALGPILASGLGVPVLLAGAILAILAAPGAPVPSRTRRRAGRAAAVSLAAGVLALGGAVAILLVGILGAVQIATGGSTRPLTLLAVIGLVVLIVVAPFVLVAVAALLVRRRALRAAGTEAPEEPDAAESEPMEPAAAPARAPHAEAGSPPEPPAS
ncbi:hypothetical protein [Brachybacterium hainanense]|uniref:Uncharacterized protein n=1 Tax=Brachybacterium hainanense TaxID=1541174 RepID=A0ABV6RAE1_9MICO